MKIDHLLKHRHSLATGFYDAALIREFDPDERLLAAMLLDGLTDLRRLAAGMRPVSRDMWSLTDWQMRRVYAARELVWACGEPTASPYDSLFGILEVLFEQDAQTIWRRFTPLFVAIQRRFFLPDDPDELRQLAITPTITLGDQPCKTEKPSKFLIA